MATWLPGSSCQTIRKRPSTVSRGTCLVQARSLSGGRNRAVYLSGKIGRANSNVILDQPDHPYRRVAGQAIMKMSCTLTIAHSSLCYRIAAARTQACREKFVRRARYLRGYQPATDFASLFVLLAPVHTLFWPLFRYYERPGIGQFLAGRGSGFELDCVHTWFQLYIPAKVKWTNCISFCPIAASSAASRDCKA
jgi:hypothetical protein